MICYCLFCRAIKSPELLDAADLLWSGAKNGVVSELTGLTANQVQKLGVKLGVPTRGYVYAETIVVKARTLRDVGMSFVGISRVTGASYQTVRNLFGAAPPLWGGAGREQMRGEVGDMLEDGCSHQEIRNTLGVSPQTIRNWFPGTAFTKEQVADRARLAQFERRLTLV